MPGRLTLRFPVEEVVAHFQVEEVEQAFEPRYNLAPSQRVPAIVNRKGQRVLTSFKWGLIPPGTADPALAKKHINARSESVHAKPTFQAAFRERRCLLPVSGWYEWQKLPLGKQPLHIQLKSQRPFGLAAIYEVWTHPDGSTRSTCAALTTAPNALLREIHERMPVILPPPACTLWLDPQVRDREALEHLFEPYPADKLEAYPVSKRVSNTRNDSPDLIAPAEPQEIPASARQLSLGEF